jgi:chemotaxis protein MotB
MVQKSGATIRNLFVAAALATSMVSCVTQKKYDDLNSKKVKLETEKADCEKSLEMALADAQSLNKQLSDLKAAMEIKDREISNLRLDTAHTSSVLRKTTQNHLALQDTYEKLLANHEKLRRNSASENTKLSGDLAAREKDLQDSQERINSLNDDLKAREARVKELENVLAEKEKAVNDLKNKVSQALLGFKDNDLKVTVKNGKVYVSLSEQLLFKSGSTDVDPKGVDALKKLAVVLKDQEDLSVMVEGHTDDVPVNKGANCLKDNWDLSVLRATSIVRILNDAGVQPEKMLPGGRSQFMPLAEGKTKEARQQNRRTEIILTPKLDELFKILNAQ